MSKSVDFDRRVPPTANHIFEAHDWHDPTNGFLLSFRDSEDDGVVVSFCRELGNDGDSSIYAMIWINADQCEEFAHGLLEAARISRSRK